MMTKKHDVIEKIICDVIDKCLSGQKRKDFC